MGSRAKVPVQPARAIPFYPRRRWSGRRCSLQHARSRTFYDRILRRIQEQLANRVKIPFAIRLWGDRVYRFGEGEPAVDILVRDPKGLAALGRLDELAICKAYMVGSLDVAGDMLRFVGLRGGVERQPPAGLSVASHCTLDHWTVYHQPPGDRDPL